MDNDGKIEIASRVPEIVALGLNHSLCISRGSATHSLSKNKDYSSKFNNSTGSYKNVLSWGKISFNCLGQGVNVATSESPGVVPFFTGKNVVQVSCGDYHSAVLVVPNNRDHKSPGTVFTFGLGNNGRLGYYIDDDSERRKEKSDTDEPSWCTPVPQPVGLSIGLKNAVTSVSCGANHTLITTSNGSLYSWGIGAFGVLGTGNINNNFTPSKVVFNSNAEVFITTCVAGSRHSVALDRDGRVWSWGYGGNGRLGLGNTKSYYSPAMIKIFGGYEISFISCGDSHTACIDRFGSVYTWGSAKSGQLGLGKILSDVLEPTIVESLSGTPITQVSCGTGYTLALSSSGSIYQWGYSIGLSQTHDGLSSNVSYIPQIIKELGSKNVYITSGPYSCAVVNAFGDLLTWGIGQNFRLGHGNTNDYAKPKFVPELRNGVNIDMISEESAKLEEEAEESTKKRNLYDERRIQQISVGDAHGVFVTCNGTVYTWGVNNGTGYNTSKDPLENYTEPCLLNSFSSKIKRIACGSNHTLAVTVNGLLFSWGCNDNGQLGLGDLRSRVFPEHVTSIENAINVYAGVDNSCCISSSSHEEFINDEYGTMWMFGSSCGGKLGLGEGFSSSVMTPREIRSISGILKVALGSIHTIALTHDGLLYSCGAGTSGRLGTGSISNSLVFTLVQTDVKFIDVAVGSSHSLAISLDNNLYGWGEGKYLPIDGDEILVPTMISTLPSPSGVCKVSSVVASCNHTLVLARSGYIVAWGDNKFGQLGIKTASNHSATDFITVPSIVLLEDSAVSIATSKYFSVCYNSKGDAFAWGLASDDRLGIGDTKEKIVFDPSPIVTSAMIGDMIDKFDMNPKLNTNLSRYTSMVESFLDELYFCNDENSVNWKNLQIVLKSEERMTWESSLKTFEDDLVKCLKRHVDFIFNMDESHERIKSLQFKLLSTMRSFSSANGHHRQDLTEYKGSDEFKRRIPYIEKIVEIIFLQPAYFVRLALFSSDIDTVSMVITSVYNRLDINRVHNQFVACLMSLLREEIRLFFNPLNPLNASFSPFARVLREYTGTKHISIENAHYFLSFGIPTSVVSYMQSCKEKILIPKDKIEPKDEKQLKNGMTNFGKFLIHLSDVLTKITIPETVKLLFSVMHKMVKVRIPSRWVVQNIPFEHLSIYPLIPIFVYSVIQPYFSNPNDLADKCGLPIIEDPLILDNLSVISQYFEYIVNPELRMPQMSDALQHMADHFYRNLTSLFLEYLKSILNVKDNFNIDMTMEIFKSHFDIECINVVLKSDLIAKFINLCAANEKYLNLSAHDPLVKIINDLSVGKHMHKSGSIFSGTLLEELGNRKDLLKIRVEHRFMIYDKNMSFCEFSNVFLPQRLAYRQHTYSEDCVKYISLIIRYIPYGKYDPGKVVQNALVYLKELGINFGTYSDICEELNNIAAYYTNLKQPDYAMAIVAKETVDVLKRLESNKIGPSSLVKTILEKVLERIKHRNYLLHIYKHQVEIDECKRNYESAVKYNLDYLTRCITCASKNYIESCILKASTTHKIKPFLKIAKEANSTKRESFSSYSCRELIKSGILVCCQSLDSTTLEQMQITFTVNPVTGCFVGLENNRRSNGSRKTSYISFSTLQAYADSQNPGFHELSADSTNQNSAFTIKARFLLDTFMKLI
ncbi:Regulator of chromosome condensation RCC1 domain containing protein [Theileria equi strain WA]|uniref:Regulator of chromosome condensation RCC1 domain containing protein n=1 Tax=Theileria equi strain WA TaxID=1537102 RepID=L1LB29_THEEQ|nr:Regulator of chromosome condensation RCC1 domain containing protein [Theileria equi strain WA]EKX72652.1 Regulator of chromosome condensation RCC1 domain containing protein [Theileria equi strain WA]|eukprot:XP_004832104.1 Regulator of chromosome condensation RCC1 domain containing protein [Theileria equi strain WA]